MYWFLIPPLVLIETAPVVIEQETEMYPFPFNPEYGPQEEWDSEEDALPPPPPTFTPYEDWTPDDVEDEDDDADLFDPDFDEDDWPDDLYDLEEDYYR